MKETFLKRVQEIINYSFCNVMLLEQALTSRSYNNEHAESVCNRELEFYGDAVLYHYVARYLLLYGKGLSKSEIISVEGNLTDGRKAKIKNEFLAQRMDELGLSLLLQEMNLGNGEKTQKTYEQLNFKADVFEAIVGAVALDCEDDVEKLSALIEAMIFSKG